MAIYGYVNAASVGTNQKSANARLARYALLSVAVCTLVCQKKSMRMHMPNLKEPQAPYQASLTGTDSNLKGVLQICSNTRAEGKR